MKIVPTRPASESKAGDGYPSPYIDIDPHALLLALKLLTAENKVISERGNIYLHALLQINRSRES